MQAYRYFNFNYVTVILLQLCNGRDRYFKYATVAIIQLCNGRFTSTTQQPLSCGPGAPPRCPDGAGVGRAGGVFFAKTPLAKSAVLHPNLCAPTPSFLRRVSSQQFTRLLKCRGLNGSTNRARFVPGKGFGKGRRQTRFFWGPNSLP